MNEPNDNEFADYFGDEAASVLDRAVDARLAARQQRQPQHQPQQQQPQPQQQPQQQGEAATDALLDCILDGDDAGASRIENSMRVDRDRSLTGEGPTGRIGMDERPRGVGMGG